MTARAAGQRNAIRRSCKSLRSLLALVQPTGFLAFLQEVGQIETDALVATPREFPAIRKNLEQLIMRLRDAGIITPQRWEEFFGDA